MFFNRKVRYLRFIEYTLKMDFKRLMIFAASALLISGFVSCKKDKNDDTYTSSKTLPGTLSIKVPRFVEKGTVLVLEPKGIDTDTVDFGFYWTASPLYTAKDTTRRADDPKSVTGAYTLNVKDTLCTMTVSCTVFAKGYSTQTVSAYCTVVDPALGGTLTESGVEEDEHFTDSRDGRTYYYKTIGNRDWLTRNVEWTGAGKSFEDCDVMDDIYGRYYTWSEAQAACPEGWRLPSDDDWLDLAKSAGYAGEDADVSFLGIGGAMMADAYFNLDKMWEFWPNVKITNATGFSAIPAGFGSKSSSSVKYGSDFEYAVFWSAENNEETGVYRMINVNRPDLMRGELNKGSFIASVRCVRK